METSHDRSALTGLRVLDFSTGPAGGQATTVLADFGADVVKVEPPGGDRFRSLPASPFWLRGKRSIVLDLTAPADRTQAHELAALTDVVVVSGPPSRIERLGIGADLRAVNPRLIHCSITGWGMHGPYAELAGYEAIVAAKFGRMAAFDVQLNQDRPVYAAVPVATHVASQAAVQGIVAGLIQRRRTGTGSTVETSLLQGLQLFDLVDVLARQLAEHAGTTFTPLRRLISMPTLNYHPLRTSDGRWIQCGNLLEHLFYSFLDAVDLLGELLVDDRFQGSPGTWTPEATEVARDRILLRVQERTAEEWMAIFEANGNVAAEPIITAQAGLAHPALAEGGGLRTVVDPVVGSTTQIGPIADLSETPAVELQGAPTVGQHTDSVHSDWSAHSSNAPAIDARDGEAIIEGQPLHGLTILDLSTIIAAPLAVAGLADLGARVIKVEPLGGDPFRALLTQGRMAVKTNAGKESICIDLKKPEGQAILHRLAADAAMLVHNFRGDVPVKLGIDFEQLQKLNPSLVVAVINGYSPTGPGGKRPATHPVMGACSGGVARQAGDALTRPCPTLDDVRETARQIMAANESNPDPNTSVVAASAMLLALYERQATNRGQLVQVSMQVANAWANSDEFIDYETKPAPDRVDTEHLGLSPRYRLYPTADGWLFLAVTVDAELARFAEAIGRTDLDALPDEQLAEAITAALATQPAADWEASLTPLGIACVRADGISVDRFITNDPHMVANGWAPTVEHQRFGSIKRWGPVVTVDGLHDDYRSAPLAGEHTDRLVVEAGFAEAEINDLRDRKVVASEPREISR
jgi:crotonobetainyl-CoA:carnitine CoA-transferase CaiB-like acyl-CoA transferase